MIRISNKNIETPVFLETVSPFVLSVENSREYYRFANDLKNAFSGEESEFSFWKGDKCFSPDKYGDIILSPFYFDAADKKIINLLYKKLQSNFNDGAFITEFNTINARVENFLFDLCSTVDFSLEHDCLCLEDLLKSCSVKPAKTYDSLIENSFVTSIFLFRLNRSTFLCLSG